MLCLRRRKLLKKAMVGGIMEHKYFFVPCSNAWHMYTLQERSTVVFIPFMKKVLLNNDYCYTPTSRSASSTCPGVATANAILCRLQLLKARLVGVRPLEARDVVREAIPTATSRVGRLWVPHRWHVLQDSAPLFLQGTCHKYWTWHQW